MYKKIITTDILPINKLKIFALLFLFVFNSNFSFAQNSIKYNKLSLSTGVLHIFENNKNSYLSSKYKRLFNNLTFSLQYSFRISKDLGVGSRVIFNKFGKNQVVENKGLNDAVVVAVNGMKEAANEKNIGKAKLAAQIDLALVDLLENYFLNKK